MDYVLDPNQEFGKRTSNLTLDNGEKVEDNKTYKVAGWATVNSQAPGRPIWDVVADYIRAEGDVKIKKVNTPKLKNMDSNPGLAG
jgi:sulfur-oxidizing protein SoxB